MKDAVWTDTPPTEPGIYPIRYRSTGKESACNCFDSQYSGLACITFSDGGDYSPEDLACMCQFGPRYPSAEDLAKLYAIQHSPRKRFIIQYREPPETTWYDGVTRAFATVEKASSIASDLRRSKYGENREVRIVVRTVHDEPVSEEAVAT